MLARESAELGNPFVLTEHAQLNFVMALATLDEHSVHLGRRFR